MKVYVNGKIIDEKKAVISVLDRGLLYGDGLFETMRSYNGMVLALDRHLQRLYRSAGMIGLKIYSSRRYIKKGIYKLLRVNRLKDAYIRLAVTRGKGRVGLNTTAVKGQSLIIIVKKFTPYPRECYEKGISLATVSIRRDERSYLSTIKSLNYLNNILARIEAQGKGADDALLFNTKGKIAESAVSNIFMIRGDRLITPSVDSGILPGITREIVLSIAHKAGLRPVAGFISLAELKGADEVFLTNTLMEIMPVIKINKKRIGSGRPGFLTRAVRDVYADRCRGIRGDSA